jgi:ferric-dicitrate binding protein FerR (iron transport regulator)
LRAGDEIRLTPNGRIDKRARVDEITIAAWRQRRLVFRADSLLDIASEFNRYNRVPRLVVEGAATTTPRYTGVFDADDPRSLLVFLRQDPQISIEERGEMLVIRPR